MHTHTTRTHTHTHTHAQIKKAVKQLKANYRLILLWYPHSGRYTTIWLPVHVNLMSSLSL